MSDDVLCAVIIDEPMTSKSSILGKSGGKSWNSSAFTNLVTVCEGVKY